LPSALMMRLGALEMETSFSSRVGITPAAQFNWVQNIAPNTTKPSEKANASRETAHFARRTHAGFFLLRDFVRGGATAPSWIATFVRV
jgi:hypothetical protein